jgi:hypothetical protein
MTIGPQVVQPRPATIVTAEVGAEVHGGIDRPGASVRFRHRSRPSRRRWRGVRGVLFTQRTVGLLRQSSKGFGLAGASTLGLGGHGWGGLSGFGPREVQHDEEPHEHE